MDINLWSFVLSIVGVLLGIVSAFAQIKSASQKVLRAAGDAYVRTAEARNAQADFFIAYPSALVAYALRYLLFAAIVIGAGITAQKYNAASEIAPWLRNLLIVLLVSASTNPVTYVILVSRQVYRRARARYSSERGS